MEWDALYIHVPFCARKCPYCDFYSGQPRAGALREYAAALEPALEASLELPGRAGAMDTVYFGGGTPALLGAANVRALLEKVRALYGIAPGAEVTLECNPGALPPGLFEGLYDAGVNRLSIGMQSHARQRLQFLGRQHTHEQTRRAAQAARRAGFENVSFDLILALPGQTKQEVTQSIAECARMEAAHVSAYLLKIEDGTPFARDNIDRICPTDDEAADLYLHAVETLRAYGYQQYEISSFARPGYESRHNSKYWNGTPYLGLGPSAHSFIGGRRRSFARDRDAFCRAARERRLFGSFWRDEGDGGGLEEYIMLRLRLREGVCFETLAARFPAFKGARALRERAAPLVREGLLQTDGRCLALTARGMLVSNSVILYLLDGVTA